MREREREGERGRENSSGLMCACVCVCTCVSCVCNTQPHTPPNLNPLPPPPSRRRSSQPRKRSSEETQFCKKSKSGRRLAGRPSGVRRPSKASFSSIHSSLYTIMARARRAFYSLSVYQSWRSRAKDRRLLNFCIENSNLLPCK